MLRAVSVRFRVITFECTLLHTDPDKPKTLKCLYFLLLHIKTLTQT